MRSPIDKIVQSLSPGEKDILRAGLIAGWDTISFNRIDSIDDQIFPSSKKNIDKILHVLMNSNPALLERSHNGNCYRFSKIGSEIAKKIIQSVQPPNSPENNPLRIVNQYKGRGENNRMMREYASENNANFVKLNGQRCTFCNHSNIIFLKKGSMLLCQECFKNGRRF